MINRNWPAQYNMYHFVLTRDSGVYARLTSLIVQELRYFGASLEKRGRRRWGIYKRGWAGLYIHGRKTVCNCPGVKGCCSEVARFFFLQFDVMVFRDSAFLYPTLDHGKLYFTFLTYWDSRDSTRKSKGYKIFFTDKFFLDNLLWFL